MNVNDIDSALIDARQFIPAAAPSVTKCDVAEAFQVFLRALIPKAGLIGAIGLRAVHGYITKWKVGANC